MMVGQLTNASYDPIFIACYQMPTIKKIDNNFFNVWADEKSGFRPTFDPMPDYISQLGDANHGLTMLAMAGTSMIANEPGGYLAWAYVQQNILPAASLNANPKWALLPRPPGPNPCSVTLSSNSITIPGNETTGSFSITNSTSECPWSAFTNNSWVKITSTSAGLGNGIINYSIQENFSTSPRTGAITINGVDFVINQRGSCAYTISSNVSVPAASSAGNVTVTASNATCAWTAVSNASWITVTSGASSAGSGSVEYSVAANTTSSSRTGTMTIAGNTFTVTQSSSCSSTLSPTSASVGASAGTGSLTVNASRSCAWTAVSNASWITITAGANGALNGKVNYSFTANSGTAPRSGTITVAGQTFTVTQAGFVCSWSLSATSVSVKATASNGSVNVLADSPCAWTAVSNVAWITVMSGSSAGSGNGTVNYSVAANPGVARSGTITIAGITYTVNQSKK
jgi:hypothetical protein